MRTIRDPVHYDRRRFLLDVFRYLDADGGGEIGEEEWLLLREVWDELYRSITELIMFLFRRFESVENAWNILLGKRSLAFHDGWTTNPKHGLDPKETLDMPSFKKLLARIKFIGETDVLFTTIDTSGDGEIEESEFFAAVYKLCPHLMPDHWLEEDKKTTAVKFVRQVTSGRAKNTQEDDNFL